MGNKKSDKHIGLYLTISFHLLLLIFSLIYSINNVREKGNSFVMDFSKEEMLEEIAKLEQMKQDVSKEIDELLNAASTPHSRTGQNVRNVAIQNQYDDLLKSEQEEGREVYEEAKLLQEKLDAAKRAAQEDDQSGDIEVNKPKQNNPDVEAYKGPSVISFKLDGRKQLHLPVPAYKCIAGGEVVVAITVDPKGYVIDANVIPARSSSDRCIIEYAIVAAKTSRFSVSLSAPRKQAGEIVYRFVAQ